MEVTLNKNGWHRKMQEFVFKDAPRYNSLCPYFWFTVFCIIFTFIIPVVPFIKLIKLIFKSSGMLLTWINKAICIPIMDSIIRGMDDSDIIKAWTSYGQQYENYSFGYKYKRNGEVVSLTEQELENWRFWRDDFAKINDLTFSKREDLANRFIKWKNITPDWEHQIETIKAKIKLDEEANRVAKENRKRELWKREEEARERLRIKAIKAKEAVARRQKMFTKIAIYTKWIAYVVVAALISAAVFGIYKLVVWIASCNIPWKTIGNTTLAILVSITIAAAFFALVHLISKLITKCQIRPSDSKFLRWIGRRFVDLWKILVWISLEILAPTGLFIYKWILTPIGGFFYGIWKGLGFVITFLKSTKDGYCPAINWEEENVNKD